MAEIYGNRWEIIEPLGEGGQGRTYLARDINNPNEGNFVLKVIKSPKGLDRFRKEIQAIKNLNHNNIVKLIDYKIDNIAPYLVTEYCEGGTLADASPFWKDDPIKSIDLFLELCEGVNYAHNHSVIHRDIKPKNIFLRKPENTPVLGDFGICFIEDDGTRLTLTDEAVGAFKFMAPEMENGRNQVTTKADVYSLGKVLYWLLSGGEIFNRELHREKEWDLKGSKFDNVFSYDKLCLEHINRILDFMIVYQPEKRRSIDNIILCLKDSRRLIKNGYNAVDENTPQICNYCGDGILTKLPEDKVPISGTTWAFYSCSSCGNILMFKQNINKLNKWWKEN
jgi:serine/threonine protein kinase